MYQHQHMYSPQTRSIGIPLPYSTVLGCSSFFLPVQPLKISRSQSRVSSLLDVPGRSKWCVKKLFDIQLQPFCIYIAKCIDRVDQKPDIVRRVSE